MIKPQTLPNAAARKETNFRGGVHLPTPNYFLVLRKRSEGSVAAGCLSRSLTKSRTAEVTAEVMANVRYSTQRKRERRVVMEEVSDDLSIIPRWSRLWKVWEGTPGSNQGQRGDNHRSSPSSDAIDDVGSLQWRQTRE